MCEMRERDQIFADVRKGLAADHHSGDRQALANARLIRPPRHLVPGRVLGKSQNDLMKVFTGLLEEQGSTVVELDSPGGVPQAVLGYLQSQDVEPVVRMGHDAWLGGFHWASAPELVVVHGAALFDDGAGVTRAFAGIAENGCVMIASGLDNPVTLNFVPETHIVVLRKEDVVASYDDGWDRVRLLFDGQMPRTVNLIAGPSRTADIGGRAVLGAHGPKRFHVLVLGKR